MNLPILGRALDERFFAHRLRSTSIAGVLGALVAVALFAYRFYVDHVWSWDLMAVAGTVVVVKVALMIWYRLTD
ncbi:MAG TPA: hypothetical protein VGE86_07005 [Thermoanaerobaculia bacterium]